MIGRRMLADWDHGQMMDNGGANGWWWMMGFGDAGYRHRRSGPHRVARHTNLRSHGNSTSRRP